MGTLAAPSLSQWDMPYRPGTQVTTGFLQHDNQVLVLQRARQDSQHCLWGIPGGKLLPNEDPVDGLVRELFEETGLSFEVAEFSLLGTALSWTECDGEYGLYLYHVRSQQTDITLNPEEHMDYRWVTLEEFVSLPLLHAQGHAYRWVEPQLRDAMTKHLARENHLRNG